MRDLIESSPTLHEIHDRVFDMDKRLGGFNEALGACEAGPWSSETDTIVNAMSVALNSKRYDIRQLPKALESELNALRRKVSVNAIDVNTSRETWEAREAKEKAREADKLRDEQKLYEERTAMIRLALGVG